MKLIKPSFEILEQGPGLEGIYEAIEIAGRTCYASEHNIKCDEKGRSTTAKDFVDRMIASKHCYTGNSEVLTENGWIPWHSYNGEKVATVDINCNFIRFETPIRIIKHSYTGNFYYFPSLGLEVTDGHRMYGLFRESKNNFYNNTLYDTFVCGQSYKDNNGRRKTLGERMFKVPKHCSVPAHTNPFYELVGFWLGDGCYQPQTVNKLVFHLKKERKIQYLQKLCDELGYTLESCKNNYYKVNNPQIGSKFNNLFYNNGKFIPNMYKAEDPIAVKSIILGLINSDGSEGVNTKTITFTSTSFSIIQWINNVAAIGGFTISSRGICHKTEVHNPVYKILILDTDYTINNDSRNPDSKVRINNKTEDVYCVTVSSGLILVRGDNGVTSICGNCAMLEHGTVYLKVPNSTVNKEFMFDTNWRTLCTSPYTKYINNGGYYYCTTNYRVIIEHALQETLEYLCAPTKFHEKRVCVKFTTSNGIMREFTRHRSHSFAVESTRYCNYTKNRFNNEVTFIEPYWFNRTTGAIKEEQLCAGLKEAETYYFHLIQNGCTPQEAREVLPLATKCDMIMTGFVSDWNHFFRLRTSIFADTGKPHPDASILTDALYKKFINENYINNI